MTEKIDPNAAFSDWIDLIDYFPAVMDRPKELQDKITNVHHYLWHMSVFKPIQTEKELADLKDKIINHLLKDV